MPEVSNTLLECFESIRRTIANRRVPSLASAETATTNSQTILSFPGNRESFALLANGTTLESCYKSALERGLITAMLSTATTGFRPVADQHGASQSASDTEQTLAENRPLNKPVLFCFSCKSWLCDNRVIRPRVSQHIA